MSVLSDLTEFLGALALLFFAITFLILAVPLRRLINALATGGFTRRAALLVKTVKEICSTDVPLLQPPDPRPQANEQENPPQA